MAIRKATSTATQLNAELWRCANATAAWTETCCGCWELQGWRAMAVARGIPWAAWALEANKGLSWARSFAVAQGEWQRWHESQIELSMRVCSAQDKQTKGDWKSNGGSTGRMLSPSHSRIGNSLQEKGRKRRKSREMQGNCCPKDKT